MRVPIHPRLLRAAELLLQHDISPQQAVILSACTSDPAPRMTDLAKLCGVSTAAMTGSIDRMAALGWVERGFASDDRRAITVTLTMEGAAIVKKLNDQISTL
jgi:DNA-binding MarR family transcriptional regulator